MRIANSGGAWDAQSPGVWQQQQQQQAQQQQQQQKNKQLMGLGMCHMRTNTINSIYLRYFLFLSLVRGRSKFNVKSIVWCFILSNAFRYGFQKRRDRNSIESHQFEFGRGHRNTESITFSKQYGCMASP